MKNILILGKANNGYQIDAMMFLVYEKLLEWLSWACVNRTLWKLHGGN
jgi:hypothetical protein